MTLRAQSITPHVPDTHSPEPQLKDIHECSVSPIVFIEGGGGSGRSSSIYTDPGMLVTDCPDSDDNSFGHMSTASLPTVPFATQRVPDRPSTRRSTVTTVNGQLTTVAPPPRRRSLHIAPLATIPDAFGESDRSNVAVSAGKQPLSSARRHSAESLLDLLATDGTLLVHNGALADDKGQSTGFEAQHVDAIRRSSIVTGGTPTLATVMNALASPGPHGTLGGA